MARRTPDGKLVRPARRPVPTPDYTSVPAMVANGLFFTGEAANTAGFCMSDYLDDQAIIRDMHDIIGVLGAVQSVLQLIEHRSVTRDEAIAAGAATCTATRVRIPCHMNYDGDRGHACWRLTHGEDSPHRCRCGEEWKDSTAGSPALRVS